MDRRVVIGVLAALILVGGGAAVLYANKGGPGAGAPDGMTSSDQLSWEVGYPKNKLNPQLEADATHTIDGGGSVEIAATCDSDADAASVKLTFNYFSKNDAGDGSKSAYETEGDGGFAHVAIPYRIDHGSTQQANSQTKYGNSAEAVFAYISPNAKVDALEGLPLVLSKMMGGVQDLQPFLHAKEVDFELPLSGGQTEIVKLYPQDSGFQGFLSQCKIGIARLDAETARHQAETAQADHDKAVADASEAARKKAVFDACATGGHDLRVVTAATIWQDDGNTRMISADQTVQSVANDQQARADMCLVTLSDQGVAIQGKMGQSALALAGTPPPAPATDTDAPSASAADPNASQPPAQQPGATPPPQ